MPKKTAYSRNGAQRSKTKQRSFELVRPASDENVLETVESSSETETNEAEEALSVVETKAEVKEKELASAKVSAPAAAATASGSPRSASARMAARRQAAQKAQRPTANMILAENYGYVRKDLIFILILAIIMFSAIIALHFVIGG
jgi:hypothetical protein